MFIGNYQKETSVSEQAPTEGLGGGQNNRNLLK